MLSKRSIVVIFSTLLLLLSALTLNNISNPVQQVAIEETIVLKKLNTKYLECLATGIYYEAANEPFIGQIAVARVIMNRVLHGFASNPCKVVYQTTTTNNDGDVTKSCQFSWVCEGKTTPSEDNPRYRRALEIAKSVLVEDKWNDILPNNTLFFHNMTVSPRWVYRKVTVIGNHVFYSKGKEKKILATAKDK